MLKENASTDKTSVKLWEPKPIETERAEEICRQLAVRLNDDTDINLLLELVLGLSVGLNVLRGIWRSRDVELPRRARFVLRDGIAQAHRARG